MVLLKVAFFGCFMPVAMIAAGIFSSWRALLATARVRG
jgi:hypothetical protein